MIDESIPNFTSMLSPLYVFRFLISSLDVALVANFAENLAEHPTGPELVKYLLIFAPAWHIWSDLREIMNSYYTDDLVQRLVILWIMALLVVYGNNATLVGDDLGAMRTTVGAWMAARLTVVAVYVLSSWASWQHRVQVRIMAALMVVGVCVAAPLLVDSVSIRAKVAVVTVGIVFQEFSWMLAYGPWIKSRLNLEYSTAVDISHEIDRLAAFYIIILGEYLYSIVVGNPAAIGLNTALLKAVWTLIVAFCLNWLYVNADGSPDSTHPIRRSAATAFAFFSLHLPLAASLLVGGHVCASSVSVDELEHGQRWLLGGGLGIGMFCLFIHAALFESASHERASCELVMSKWLRIGMRPVVGIVLVLLPLTNADEFNPTKLLSTVMGLFAFVTIWETIGGLTRGAKIWEPWHGRNGVVAEEPEPEER